MAPCILIHFLKVFGGYHLDKPKDCPPEVYHIMESTWQEVSKICNPIVYF